MVLELTLSMPMRNLFINDVVDEIDLSNIKNDKKGEVISQHCQ